MRLSEDDADSKEKLENLKKAVQGEYRHNWIIDNLPAASLMENEVRAEANFLGASLYVSCLP